MTEKSSVEFDLIAHLARQRSFSLQTFGPGPRTEGICNHIRKELQEITQAPADLTEWIDVALLAFDGALRAGYSPATIATALGAKLAANQARNWPDWRTVAPGDPIEHIRTADA